MTETKEDISFCLPDNYWNLLMYADKTLSCESLGYTERTDGKGRLLYRFVVPLAVAKPTNAARHAQGWMLAKCKKRAYQLMSLQTTNPQLLGGRPFIRCIRFSSVECDAYANHGKIPVDVLMVGDKNRLGIIRDDAPRYVEIKEWWEYSKKGYGFELVEVFSG
jgi:hypothetical protein